MALLLLLLLVMSALCENPLVKIETTLGTVTIELDEVHAPITVANFLKYVDDGFYDGTIFHRVIKNFMIQGGGFTDDMVQKQTREGIKNEWQNGLKNVYGSIAMARLGGKPDSATSQFFINVKDNSFLDTASDGAAYAVFGKVIDGLDTVQAIEGVKTGKKNGMGDVPQKTVLIKKVIRVGGDEPAPTAPPPPTTTAPTTSDSSSMLVPIVAGIAAVALIAAIVTGVIIYKKKRSANDDEHKGSPLELGNMYKNETRLVGPTRDDML